MPIRALSLALLCLALAQSQPRPEQSFSQRCASCHGDDASGSDRAPALARSRRLRTRSLDEIRDIIHNGTPGGMPPFPLPDSELRSLAAFVRAMNATAFDAKPPGDPTAGQRFFFGKGQCGTCHIALGRGKSVGPDLSNIARQLTVADLTRKFA